MHRLNEDSKQVIGTWHHKGGWIGNAGRRVTRDACRGRVKVKLDVARMQSTVVIPAGVPLAPVRYAAMRTAELLLLQL